MGFLKNLISKKDDKEGQPPSQEKAKDLRVHYRYDMQRKEDFCLVHKGTRYPFLDLSYGGFALTKEDAEKLSSAEAELHVFDEICPAKFHPVHSTEATTGYSFKHETPDLLLFLRKKIEFLRMGFSSTRMAKELLKEPYSSPEWNSYRGDGPCDIQIKNVTHGVEGLIIFLLNGPYVQIKFKDNHITTGRSEITKSGQTHSKITESSDADPDLLKGAYLVLLGAYQKNHDAVLLDYIKLVDQLIHANLRAS